MGVNRLSNERYDRGRESTITLIGATIRFFQRLGHKCSTSVKNNTLIAFHRVCFDYELVNLHSSAFLSV